jgi:hypothetical protein
MTLPYGDRCTRRSDPPLEGRALILPGISLELVQIDTGNRAAPIGGGLERERRLRDGPVERDARRFHRDLERVLVVRAIDDDARRKPGAGLGIGRQVVFVGYIADLSWGRERRIRPSAIR